MVAPSFKPSSSTTDSRLRSRDPVRAGAAGPKLDHHASPSRFAIVRRPAEILALGTADIDLERSHLTIQKGKSSAARRQLKLSGESREACTAWDLTGRRKC
jgi:integrase